VLELPASKDVVHVDRESVSDTWLSRGRNSPLLDAAMLPDGTALPGRVVRVELDGQVIDC